MWRMELSVVWMVATGKLQYPLQKPVSSLSQTVIGGRKRFHLCFGFQFSPFLFYIICRIQQIWNSAVVSPKLKWIGEWKNHRYTVNIYRYKAIGANATSSIISTTWKCISSYSFVPINIYSVWQNFRCDMNPWKIYIPAVDYENKLHLIWIISPVHTTLQT